MANWKWVGSLIMMTSTCQVFNDWHDNRVFLHEFYIHSKHAGCIAEPRYQTYLGVMCVLLDPRLYLSAVAWDRNSVPYWLKCAASSAQNLTVATDNNYMLTRDMIGQWCIWPNALRFWSIYHMCSSWKNVHRLIKCAAHFSNSARHLMKQFFNGLQCRVDFAMHCIKCGCRQLLQG